jgi:hypothetical protein
MIHQTTRRWILLALLVTVVLTPVRAQELRKSGQMILRSHPSVAVPASMPSASALSEDRRVSFIVDGDFYDADLGRFGDDINFALQALYMNRFSPTIFPLILDQVQIFFACNQNDGSGDCLGMEIDVIVAEDKDGDGTPQTGTETVAVHQGVIQVVDGVTFSVYDLDPPVLLEGPGDIYVGFIPRFIESNVTSFTLPAAVDQTGPRQGRSWLMAWQEDPADPPVFPADFDASTTEDAGFPSNLKIRAFGRIPEGPCFPDGTTLCLGEGGRFEVRVAFSTEQGGGHSGEGQAIPLGDRGLQDGGVFWFFNQENPEMLVKVLDACALPDPHFWVFYAATTTVGFDLTVRDTDTDVVKRYTNPDLQRADAVTDTRALATCP